MKRMEPEADPAPDEADPAPDSAVSAWTTVTPLSKYLAMVLFVLLPFFGGWIGYTYAPEKVVEVEKVVIKEVEKSPSADNDTDIDLISYVSIKNNQNEYSIYDTISIEFGLVSENYIDSSGQKKELYLIDDTNTLQRFIAEVESSAGNIEFIPEDTWRNAGLDIITTPPKTGDYRVLLLVREKVQIEPGPRDYPVDTLDNPFTVYKDGYLENTEALKHGIAPKKLFDSAVSETFHITNPIAEEGKG